MADPFNTEENTLPEPHAEFAGVNRKDSFGRKAFAAVARLWRPRGSNMEPAAATVSRYAMRLVDRKTGKAFSADELESSLVGKLEADYGKLPWMLAGCVAAWHIDDVELSSGKVTQWNDLTGNGKHLTQSNDSLRAAWAADGAQHAYGAHYVINGGVSLDHRDFTVIFIGRCNRTVEPRGNGGYLFQIGSSGPAANWTTWNTALSSPTTYAPTMITKSMGLSSFVVAGGNTETRVIVNGSVTQRNAFNAGSGTLAKIFSDNAGNTGTQHPATAALVFNRALETPEIQEILAFFNAGVPSRKIIYPIGDSIALGTGATTHQNTFAAKLGASLGADLAFYGIGGQTLATLNAVTVAEIQPHVGAQNLYHIMSGTNDNATAPGQSSSIISNTSALCGKIRAADPAGRIVIATMLPRNNYFSGGQDASGFESVRGTVNASIRANWTTYANAIADYAGNGAIGDAADADNTTYYGDKVHPTDTGYAVMYPIAATAAHNVNSFGVPGQSTSFLMMPTFGNSLFYAYTNTGTPDAFNWTLLVDGTGTTINSSGGAAVKLDVGGTVKATLNASGLSLASGVYLEGTEQTAPTAPTANSYRIFARDNAGKTELMVLFATGSAQRLAIEL